MAYPLDVRYTKEHEWARVEDGAVTVGITSYATDQLGDVVFVELPEVGRKLEAGKPFGEGWMIRIRAKSLDDLNGLLSPDDYEKLIEEQHA